MVLKEKPVFGTKICKHCKKDCLMLASIIKTTVCRDCSERIRKEQVIKNKSRKESLLK